MARHWILVALVFLLPAGGAFSLSSSAPGIDVELSNPEDGSQRFCPAPGESFWVEVLVRPGPGSSSCDLGCGAPIPGGTAALATGVIDLDFDQTLLQLVDVETNPATVAAQGLIQDNRDQGRIGWALAGNWSVPGDASSALLGPCDMEFLQTTDWVFRVQFQALPTASGGGGISVRRPPAFALSFADLCGSDAFTLLNGAVDEVVDAMVYVNVPCGEPIFSDDFETGNTGHWSAVHGS